MGKIPEMGFFDAKEVSEEIDGSYFFAHAMYGIYSPLHDACGSFRVGVMSIKVCMMNR